jgi:hypothetical protein
MRECYTCGLVEGVRHEYAPWGFHEGRHCDYGDDSTDYQHTWLAPGPAPGQLHLDLPDATPVNPPLAR